MSAASDDPAPLGASAPGRVNLLGEHTDYNDGLVLPTTDPQRTQVRLAWRDDLRVSAYSPTLAASAQEYELGREQRGRGWLDYVQGVTWALRGVARRGFDVRISSQIPTGSGLSSSAALLVALLRALRQGMGLALSDVELARLCQQIENQFVGAPVGILDPLACSLCQPDRALFIDTRTLHSESLPLPRAVELLVIHSGISHGHAESDAQRGDYRLRRAECERAAQKLGVKSLRQLEADDAARAKVASLEPLLLARVRHVLTENARVREAVQLLRRGAETEADLAALGALFAASHRSQRDDYAVSLPAVDLLVEIGAADRDIIHRAARLTGGGFGGSVVMLARRGTAAQAAQRIAARYQSQSGHTPIVLVPRTESEGDGQ